MKIGIIGSGMVGATAAYACLMQGIGREIVLVDQNRARADAEADDILHAVPFAHPLRVCAGDYADLSGARAVVVTAGVGQKPGETRLQLLGRNAAVFRQVIPSILQYAPEAMLVIATNPVDIMTHLTSHYAAETGVSMTHVIGSGTTLDTARFRAMLGEELGIDSRHVHAYVIGEHGDSEVLNWSAVNIGGIPLEEFCHRHPQEYCNFTHHRIDHEVRQAAYNIIAGKGATYYGVGSALARIVRVILSDERSILTVCSHMDEIMGIKDVTLSVPHLVGGSGIQDIFPPVLDEGELAAFRRSAQVIKDVIHEMEAEQIT